MSRLFRSFVLWSLRGVSVVVVAFSSSFFLFGGRGGWVGGWGETSDNNILEHSLRSVAPT